MRSESATSPSGVFGSSPVAMRAPSSVAIRDDSAAKHDSDSGSRRSVYDPRTLELARQWRGAKNSREQGSF
jgi:hypothetical protein